MKINMQIIYDNLTQSIAVQQYGPTKDELTLNRILFYAPKMELKRNCIYLAHSDSLGKVLDDFSNIPFICLGGGLPSKYTSEKYRILLVKEQMDVLRVFNMVQDIFDRYDTWDEELQQLVATSADVRKMAEISLPIFENPIFMTDQNLHLWINTQVLENGGTRLQLAQVDSTITAEDFKKVVDAHPQNQTKRSPFFYADGTMYCVNLFVGNLYAATLSIACRVRPFCKSDFRLLEHLGERICGAIKKQARAGNSHVKSVKTIFHDLLNSLPVEEERIEYALRAENGNACKFFCFAFKTQDIAYGVPPEYINQTLEGLLPGCVSMEYDYTVVNYVRLRDYPHAYEESLQVLERFLRNSDFQAGVSNVFADIVNARYYYQQACCAIDTGKTLDPDRTTYCFSDYALSYMIGNSAGALPPEYVCHEGLLRLKKESSASVDYWGTLRAYLGNGMNAVQTAKELYLHRSTVLYRLSRISEILKMDMSYMEQLQYLIYSMNLLELRDKTGQ